MNANSYTWRKEVIQRVMEAEELFCGSNWCGVGVALGKWARDRIPFDGWAVYTRDTVDGPFGTKEEAKVFAEKMAKSWA